MLIRMHEHPPTPTSVDDIPPQLGEVVSLLNHPVRLDDVNASPLYAFFKTRGDWINIDRRAMHLEVFGQWKLILSSRITADAPLSRTVSIEEGIVTTEAAERSFAVSVGVDASVPNIGIGASISTSLSETLNTSVETSERTTTTTNFTASTDEKEALFWFWQLDLKYVITGVKRFYHVTSDKDKKRLASDKDSSLVTTRDGHKARQLNHGIPKLSFFKQENFRDEIIVGDQIFVTTQYPAASVSAEMKRPDAQPLTLVDYRSPYSTQTTEPPARTLEVVA